MSHVLEEIKVLKTLTVSHIRYRRYSASGDNVIDNSVTSPPSSSSRRKLECGCDIQNELPNGEPLSFLLINCDIVTELINLVGCCKECNSRELAFENDVSNKKGLSNCLCISCNKCQWSYFNVHKQE